MNRMPRVLIVDDERVTRDFVRKTVGGQGYEVLLAPSGEDALILLEGDNHIDVILLDIMMPGLNGYEVLEILKNDPRTGHIKVIMLSALSQSSDKVTAFSAGASDYIVKPFETGELLARIETQVRLTQTEKALRESEMRYRAVSALVSDFSYILRPTSETSFELEWMTDTISDVSGYTRDEFIQRGGWRALIHPDDMHIASRLFDSFAAGRPNETEYRIISQGGEVRWLSHVAQPVQDNTPSQTTLIYNAVRDITARKQAEEALRMLERAVEQSIDGIAVADMAGRILFTNPAWAQMHGYRREEVLGQHLSIFHTQKQVQEEVEPFNRQVLEFGAQQGQIGHARKDGSVFPTWMTVTLLKDEGGKPTGLVGTVRDITNRVEAEEALQSTNEQLKQALVQANEFALEAEMANRAKSEFLANMSHEIRTPMNGIIGMTELALATELNSEQRDYLGAVQTSSEALLSLINDILDFSKIEAGRLELEQVDFDLRQIVEQVADIMAQRASQKGLELMLHLSPDVPRGVRGDPLRLRQVLVNLAGNAIKFTDHGQVVVQVRQNNGSEGNVELLCAVSDTGVGIPPDKQDVIFESFTQADGSTTRQYGGSGLGLAISKQLVELMGGRLWVESEGVHGSGSTFNFTMVLERQPDWVNPVPAESLNIQEWRVLTIDDNATNRRILGETLRAFGCRSDDAPDGPTGLRMLERAVQERDPFALVLLDVRMPDMDGLEVLQLIRRTKALASLKVIMLTSVDVLGNVASRKELGWSAYLTKPVKQSQLLDTVLDTMGREALEKGELDIPTLEPAPAETPTAPLRILLVEDNEINRRLAVILLNRFGHQVAVAENGRIALDVLEQGEFDLVFMDVQMPEMDGFEATAAIRADARWADLPIIAMTAHALEGDRERCLAAGMDDYVSKPVRAAQVLHAIERQMARINMPFTPLPADAPPQDALATLDRAGAMERLGIDPAIFDELFSLWLETADEQLEQLCQAIEQENANVIQRLGHNIKGSAASVGADRVSEVAGRLEIIGKSGDLTDAAAVLARLEKEKVALQEHVRPSA